MPDHDSLRPSMGAETAFLQSNIHIWNIPKGIINYNEIEIITLSDGMLYFYLPAGIINAVNVVFFILTALKIHQSKRDVAKVISMNDQQNHLTIRNEK